MGAVPHLGQEDGGRKEERKSRRNPSILGPNLVGKVESMCWSIIWRSKTGHPRHQLSGLEET